MRPVTSSTPVELLSARDRNLLLGCDSLRAGQTRGASRVGSWAARALGAQAGVRLYEARLRGCRPAVLCGSGQ